MRAKRRAHHLAPLRARLKRSRRNAGSPAPTGTLKSVSGFVERRRIEFLVPVADSAKRPFPHDYFRVLDQFLLRLANGFTDEGVARGGWVSLERRAMFDETVRYRVTVAIDRAADVAHRIETLVKTLFHQEAVCVDITAVFTSGY